jgi:hypothetical protein
VALVRRQEMLVSQIADLEAHSLTDICAKLEIWAQELDLSDDEADEDPHARLVLSALHSLKAFAAAQ